MGAKQWQIVLGGTGGQGLILGGVSLAKAAVAEGKNAVQTQTYGIQTRGGYSQAEVVISEGTVYFPKCDNPDLVLALSQAAYDRYKNKISADCIVLYDSDAVTSKGRAQDLGYPFQAKAIDLGNEKVINSLALGAVLKLCPVVSKESMAKVLEGALPAKALNLNLRAMELGYSEIIE
ncbi:2-oxoacid:ferredoxin oxidoreductase subunit gamma [Paradesulfitobacterium aromaticivorans]